MVYDRGGVQTFRRSLLIVALVAAPAEVLSFWLLHHFPIDVGWPPGTNPFIVYATAAGLWLHASAFLARADFWAGDFVEPVFFVMGYLDIVVLSLALWLLYRLVRRLVSLKA